MNLGRLLQVPLWAVPPLLASLRHAAAVRARVHRPQLPRLPRAADGALPAASAAIVAGVRTGAARRRAGEGRGGGGSHSTCAEGAFDVSDLGLGVAIWNTITLDP